MPAEMLSDMGEKGKGTAIIMKSAIIPGSFDPATLGHIDLICRAAAIFDRVYPVIVVNAEKSGMFYPDERLKILRCACRNIDNVQCEVFDGLTSDFARKVGAKFIAKGARNSTDFNYETGLAQIMKKFDSELETVFLPADPALAYMSSTYARECIRYGCSLEGIVDSETEKLIQKFYKG